MIKTYTESERMKHMKAFVVHFQVAGAKGLSETLLVEDEKDLETALEAKSLRKFDVNSSYSQIIKKQEIPLSKVKIGELSITEFLLLTNK